jgi:predicted permease
MRQLKYAWRTLRRTPVFLLTAIATLGLGIGATTAIFSLFYQVLLRQLPVRQPQQLVVLHETGSLPGLTSSDNYESVFSYPMYRDLQDRSSAVSQGMIARAPAGPDITRNGITESVQAELVSGNFFQVLGLTPFSGRLLTTADDVIRKGNDVAVLGYAFWSNRCGRANLIGQTVLINNHAAKIVGIAPPEFRSVLSGQTPDVYLPISMAAIASPGFNGFEDPSWQCFTVMARLRPGVSRETAQAALNPVFTDSLRNVIETFHIRSRHSRDRVLANHLELHAAAAGLNELKNSWEKSLRLLIAAAGVLLLIACSNLAGLLMVRGSARRHEIAIRRSVGATRRQIIAQLLSESILLALLGGGVGIFLSLALTAGVLRMVPPEITQGWVGSRFDWPVLAFTLSVAVVAGVSFGILPAWQVSGETASVLRDQSHQLATGSTQTRWRRTLVISEIALCLVLLAGAGLFTKSLFKLLRHNPGFHSENLLTFMLNPGLNGYQLPQALNLYGEVQQRLSAKPGVIAVSFCQYSPFSKSNSSSNISIDGYHPTQDEDMNSGDSLAGPDFFRTLGIPLLQGREFTWADGLSTQKVVVVNQAFVRRFLRGREPLGVHMSPGAGSSVKLDRQIVGVVADAQFGNLREPARPYYFLPYAQARAPISDPAPQAAFLVRTHRAEPALPSIVRNVVASLDHGLPVSKLASMQVQISNSVFQDRAVAVLAGAGGFLALLLASLGLYGVVAYSVNRRISEIGVRMALGADRRSILSLVLREVLWMISAGAVLGLAAAVALSRAIQSQLFGVQAADASVLAGSAVVLSIVALLAGAVPSLRAARVDPIRALRHE